MPASVQHIHASAQSSRQSCVYRSATYGPCATCEALHSSPTLDQYISLIDINCMPLASVLCNSSPWLRVCRWVISSHLRSPATCKWPRSARAVPRSGEVWRMPREHTATTRFVVHDHGFGLPPMSAEPLPLTLAPMKIPLCGMCAATGMSAIERLPPQWCRGARAR